MADIIAEEYNKIESSISISPSSFSPPGAESYVRISMGSTCKNSVTYDDTVTCQQVTVNTNFTFTAAIEVDEGICAEGVLNTTGIVSFDLKIFGQSYSSLRLDLSLKFLCNKHILIVYFDSPDLRM